MKKCIVMMLCGLSAAVMAGALNPPAGPTVGTMKTLEDVEPRTAIRQADIPKLINAPGAYYLAENVTTASGTCIVIDADQVTLDLNGFTLTGNGSGTGIYMNWQKNIEIRNGAVSGFMNGIYDSNSGGKNYTISNVRIVSCGQFGINFAGCENITVEKCTISDGGTLPGINGYVYGINTGGNSIVSDNKIQSLGASVTTSGHVYGIYTGAGCRISGNTVADLGDTAATPFVIGIYANNNCVINDNAIYSIGTNATATVHGICASNSNIRNNSTGYTGKGARTVYGIVAGASVISGNNSYYDGEGATENTMGIAGSSGCTIINNAVSNTGRSAADVTGIYAGSGCTVKGNTTQNNGFSATGNVYGIRIISNCLVDGNTSYNNYGGTDINVSSSSVYGMNVPNVH